MANKTLMDILRNWSFAGGVLVAGVAALSGGCSSETTFSHDIDGRSAEQIDKEEHSAEQIDKEMRRFACPGEPTSLTKQVITQYAGNYGALRNAMQRNYSDTEAYHFYKALGDKDAARAVLTKVFEVHGISCSGFEPTVDELNQRAERILSRKQIAVRSWKEAFTLFGKAGNRNGQLRVAQAYEREGTESGGVDAYNLDLALKLYEELGITGAPKRIAHTIFNSMKDMERGIEIVQERGFEPSSQMYTARGDYWMGQTGYISHLDLAFEAYKAAGDKPAVRRLINTIDQEEERERELNFKLAANASLFVGDQEAAQRYAREHFVQGYGDDLSNQELFKSVGLKITPDLWKARAEHHLSANHLWSAYRGYEKAGDLAGMKKAIDAMVAPLSPSEGSLSAGRY